jgi:hypothetical protein
LLKLTGIHERKPVGNESPDERDKEPNTHPLGLLHGRFFTFNGIVKR